MKRTPVLIRFRRNIRVRGDDACWEWLGARTAAGYGVICLGGRGGKHVYAHRMMWDVANDNDPTGFEVCHRCDNPSCVNPRHLFLGTHAENMRDCKAKRRHTHGDRHPSAKLNSTQVAEIRELYAGGGISQYELAERYGVSRGCIEHIVLRSTWAAA